MAENQLALNGPLSTNRPECPIASSNALKSRQGLWLWAAFACVVILGALWQFYPLQDAEARLSQIPREGLGFQGQDLSLTADEASILSNVHVIRRGYRFGSNRLILTVIDGTRNRHAVHDPFYCIRGSGWEILNNSLLSVKGGEARLIRMRKNRQETEALVWFSEGTKRYPSASRYWWKTTLRRLTLGHSGPEPVLVNLQAADGELINWSRIPHEYPWLFDF
jgi:hypothetical protein